MTFTQTQRQAIAHDTGNLQLIACAGSGKTEVVARRVANLLKKGANAGLAPRNIVAFTFTDKAAAELKDRIVTRCREEFGNIHGLAEMFVGTIHAFALDLLMTEVHDLLKFNILNEVQQTLFIDRHSKTSGLTTCTDTKGAALRRFRDTPHYLSALNIMREDELDAQILAATPLPAALDTYQTLLQDRSYFDYSEIVSRAVVELDAANIRYVVVGMNNLFDTREANAARELFYYMAGRATSDATTVFDAWTNAALGLTPADIQAAIANVTDARQRRHYIRRPHSVTYRLNG